MKDSLSRCDLSFSLEVYPPKTPEGEAHLLETIETYLALYPAAITVTFGANGTKESEAHLRSIIAHLREKTEGLSIPIVAHMTCANRSQTDVYDTLDHLWADGIHHFVALRGDLVERDGPYQPHPQGFATTHDYIAGIRTRFPEASIYVAGYPETHPESPSEAFDIDHLKRKIDAGANGVLTQFFFDPEVFLRWRDKVEKRGITVPLVPGLMPIIHFAKICAMSKRCGARVPDFLHTMFRGVSPESLDHHLLAMNVLSHQITRLTEHGVNHFHFYTMNETLLTRHVCTWLRAGF